MMCPLQCTMINKTKLQLSSESDPFDFLSGTVSPTHEKVLLLLLSASLIDA
jgi:hypothetical protein